MCKRYFRKREPDCPLEQVEWVEMTGKEFYSFVSNPENKQRHFIYMGDIVLEVDSAAARSYRAEQKHSGYILKQEEGWETLSIYSIEGEDGCCGDEMIRDETQNVETLALMNIERTSLYAAVAQLDSDSYRLIKELYLSEPRKTLRQYSQESGIPVMTLQDRKKKALKLLRKILSKNF